ncbi:MAG: hypothetical protein AAGG38_13485 [Planctomycetota bacterium]
MDFLVLVMMLCVVVGVLVALPLGLVVAVVGFCRGWNERTVELREDG